MVFLRWKVIVSLATTLMMGCTPWWLGGFREPLSGRNRIDSNRFHFINTHSLATTECRRRILGHVLSSAGETKGGEEFIEDENRKTRNMKESSNAAVRSSVRLKICDADHGEDILSERGEIFFQGASPSTKQATLEWKEPPRRALLLVKPEEVNTILAAKAAIFLLTELLIDVFVEIHFADSVRKQIAVIAPEMKRLPFMVKPFCKQELDVNTMEEETVGFAEDGVDFVVSLGGDGLLLHASTLFPRSVPPHICFNCGSMGFLTPFSCDRLTDVIRDIVLAPKPLNINLRMRLSARILHNGQLSCFFYALNEVAIQREGGTFMSNLECFCDDKRFTTVQADGLVIATPTGSTAYSMSAGGSIAHPNLLGILFTPICPHSLSFRPIVFPETVSIRCDVPLDARGEAVVSFDGKTPRHLYKGDSLMVQMSSFPMPTICQEDSTADWFRSLNSAFGYNSRSCNQKQLKGNMEQYQ